MHAFLVVPKAISSPENVVGLTSLVAVLDDIKAAYFVQPPVILKKAYYIKPAKKVYG